MKKFNCDHCTFSTNYKRSMSRHTEVKHPVQHVLGKKKTGMKSGTILGREKKSISCLCLPMFYTVQIWENSPKQLVKNKKSVPERKSSGKHEDKQQGKGGKS